MFLEVSQQGREDKPTYAVGLEVAYSLGHIIKSEGYVLVFFLCLK